MIDDNDLRNRFNFHPTTGSARSDAHTDVRVACLGLAMQINARVPDSREKSIAVAKLEEVMMWANAAIARHGLPKDLGRVRARTAPVCDRHDKPMDYDLQADMWRCAEGDRQIGDDDVQRLTRVDEDAEIRVT